MPRALIAMLLFAATAMAETPLPRDPLDSVAERYVRLVLAVGRHDGGYVDAYYGPAAWKAEVDAGEAKPLAALMQEARALLQLTARQDPSPRGAFLETQLRSVETYLRLLTGEKMALAEEARLLFDIEPPAVSSQLLEQARTTLASLLPGEGDLEARMQAFRQPYQVPAQRLPAVVDLCLQELRRRTGALVKLPEGERFEVVFVGGKPWGAYNWYQGDFASRIEINTDSPMELDRVIGLLAHEGYPGHHVYNALLEDRLVKGKGWVEYTVYPLHSPQSLIAEGTANVGVDIVFTAEEKRRFLVERLAPAAAMTGLDWTLLEKVREAAKPLRLASTLAAVALLDQGKPETEALEILTRLGLQSPERAQRGISFIRHYRSYIYTYWVGEDMVEAWLATTDFRQQRFFDLLQRPAIPSDLVVRKALQPRRSLRRVGGGDAKQE